METCRWDWSGDFRGCFGRGDCVHREQQTRLMSYVALRTNGTVLAVIVTILWPKGEKVVGRCNHLERVFVDVHGGQVA